MHLVQEDFDMAAAILPCAGSSDIIMADGEAAVAIRADSGKKRNRIYSSFGFLKRPKVEENLDSDEVQSLLPLIQNLQLVVGDRISDLPDDILYRIISSSSFSINDIACLSSTSRRFREICTSNPYLTFDAIQRCYTIPQRDLLSISYIPNFLAKRKKMIVNKEINRFQLRWSCRPRPAVPNSVNERLCLESWIHEVLDSSFNLQELVLELDWANTHPRPLVLPFNSCLKRLHLNLWGAFLELPHVNPGSILLETLTLTRASIHRMSNLGKWISQSCKRLKRLVLNHMHCVRNLEIISECIEQLTIIDCNCMSARHHPREGLMSIHISAPNLKELAISWKIPSWRNKSIKLHAPNLEVINWNCYALDDCDLGVFKSLKSATISFPSPFYIHPFILYKHMSKMLESIQAAKFLTLNSLYLEVLLKENNRSIILENLESLRIEVFGSSNNSIMTSAGSSFVNTAPNLKTITTFSYGSEECQFGDSGVPIFRSI